MLQMEGIGSKCKEIDLAVMVDTSMKGKEFRGQTWMTGVDLWQSRSS
jgi:hypothetical protein